MTPQFATNPGTCPYCGEQHDDHANCDERDERDDRDERNDDD